MFAAHDDLGKHRCWEAPNSEFICDLFCCGYVPPNGGVVTNAHYRSPAHGALSQRFVSRRALDDKVRQMELLESEAGPVFRDAFMALVIELPPQSTQVDNVYKHYDGEPLPDHSPFPLKLANTLIELPYSFRGPVTGEVLGRVGDEWITKLMVETMGFTHNEVVSWAQSGSHQSVAYVAMVLARLFPDYESPADLFAQWYRKTHVYRLYKPFVTKKEDVDRVWGYATASGETQAEESSEDEDEIGSTSNKEAANADEESALSSVESDYYEQLLIIVAKMGISFETFHNAVVTSTSEIAAADAVTGLLTKSWLCSFAALVKAWISKQLPAKPRDCILDSLRIFMVQEKHARGGGRFTPRTDQVKFQHAIRVVGDKFYPGEPIEKVEDRLLGGNGSFPLPRLLKLIFIEELGVQKLGKCWKWPQAVGALQVFVTKKRAAQARAGWTSLEAVQLVHAFRSLDDGRRKGHDTVPFGQDDAVLVGKIFTHRSPAEIQEFVASHQSDLKNISLLFPPSASDKVILSIATTFQLRV